jgi:hypothetical protein
MSEWGNGWPNTFALSADLLRYWMPWLSGNEFKLAVWLYTRSYALYRPDVATTPEALKEQLGMTAAQMLEAVGSLEARGALWWEETGNTWHFVLNAEWRPSATEVIR